MSRPFDDIAADEAAIIAGERRELRRGERVARHVYGGIGLRAQIVVDDDAFAVMRDLTGVEIERIDIGDSPGAVDDAVGPDKALRAAALIDDTQAVADRLDALHLDTGVQRDADALA